MDKGKFWLDSSNLTTITGLKDAFTGVLLTSDDVESITAELLDADGNTVGDSDEVVIVFSYSVPGTWYVVWDRPMEFGNTYTLVVTVTCEGASLVLYMTRVASYKGPTA